MQKRLLVGGMVVSGIIVLSLLYNNWRTASPASETPSAKATTAQSATAEETKTNAIVQQQLQAIIDSYSDIELGVSAVNLKSGDTIQAGEANTAFKGASTIKILTAVHYLHQVEQNNATLSTVIDGTEAQTLLQRMLQNSSNTAWASLNEYLNEDAIEAYAHEQGLTSYHGRDYKTITPNDMALLLAKLDNGQLLTASHKDLLYSFMQNTDNETLIPAAVDTNTFVRHKWGTLWSNLHDAAIISTDSQRYALVIYTKGTGNNVSAGQAEAIRKLTAAFVNYSIYNAHVTL